MARQRFTLEELEEMTGENHYDVIADFFESCIRTGHFNLMENAKYFMRENRLAKSEFGRVYDALYEIDRGNY